MTKIRLLAMTGNGQLPPYSKKWKKFPEPYIQYDLSPCFFRFFV